MSDLPAVPPPAGPAPPPKPRLLVTNPKVVNPGVPSSLRRYLDEPDWKKTNVLIRQMGRRSERVEELITGRVPLFIMCGPPGIAKSRETVLQLDQYTATERAKWLATPKQERPERRTMLVEDTDREEFRPMYYRLTGRVSQPMLHCRMYWCSYRREVMFVDDVASLNDVRVQETLQMASDLAARRMVQYNYQQKNLPDDRVPVRYPMRGSIVVACNLNQRVEGDRIIELFTQPLVDRAVFLHFSFETMPLLQYVCRMAFVRKKGGPDQQTSGLLRFVYGEPSDTADDDDADDDLGLGYKGEVGDAMKMLQEVRDYFLVNHERALISFRTLRKLTRDRFTRGKDWTEYAEDHLRPRPLIEAKQEGDRAPAHTERPDPVGRK